VIFKAIYEKGATSWGAYVPDLLGVIAVASSRQEAETLIREAILGNLETMLNAASPFPNPPAWLATPKLQKFR